MSAFEESGYMAFAEGVRIGTRAQALQDAIDTIRAACKPCGGDGIAMVVGRNLYECQACGAPIAAVKALMGGPEAARAKVRS
jgi:hypothetical protein